VEGSSHYPLVNKQFSWNIHGIHGIHGIYGIYGIYIYGIYMEYMDIPSGNLLQFAIENGHRNS
jgi:hypothetical protein